jgi:hypothetical protein
VSVAVKASKHVWSVFVAAMFATIASASPSLKIEDVAKSLPSGISPKGTVVKAAGWRDTTGQNLVVLTESGVHEGNAEIRAVRYKMSEGAWGEAWKVFDQVKDCQLDIEASFAKSAFQVTDLDGNGVAEVWMAYYLACQGDVSPMTMKIIMYEGDKKYAVRGETKVSYSKIESEGGANKLDPSFDRAPPEFKTFALGLWDKFCVRK